MRSARAGDYWRTVYKRNYSTKLKSIIYEGIPGLGESNGGIEFLGGITAICGQNGTGKSTLLQCIYRALTPDNSNERYYFKPRGVCNCGKISGSVNIDDKPFDFSCDLSKEESGHAHDKVELSCLEPGRESPELLDRFRSTTNIDELLEASEPAILKTSEIDEISCIVGKDYDSIKIYELDAFGDLEVVPYFEVSTKSITYKTEQMGVGEFSIFYICWALRRIKRNSILLLEEPECFIYPRSQLMLMDYLAKVSAERGIWCIVTTHSPLILANIPTDHIYVFMSPMYSPSIIRPRSSSDYLDSLGIIPPKRGIILVEDDAARQFFISVAAQFSPITLREFEVFKAGSDSDILKILDSFPGGPNSWPLLIGIIDGGVNIADTKYISKKERSILFLPGGKPPDQLLKDVAYRKELQDKITILIGSQAKDIALHFSVYEGANFHDWHIEISKLLSVSTECLIKILVSVWIHLDENRTAIESFIQDLEKATA